MARRFECTEDNSSKFWEVEQTGSSVTTWWGRIGTAGQSKTKDFASDAAARAEYEKLIGEKTRKGYIEIGGAPVAQASTPAKSAASVPAQTAVKAGAAGNARDTRTATAVSTREVETPIDTRSTKRGFDLGWDEHTRKICRELMLYVGVGAPLDSIAQRFGVEMRILKQMSLIQRFERGLPCDDLLSERRMNQDDVKQMREAYIRFREEQRWSTNVGPITVNDRKYLDYLLEHLINKKPIVQISVMSDLGSPGAIDFLCFYRHWVNLCANEHRRILADIEQLGWSIDREFVDRVREATRVMLKGVGLPPEPLQIAWRSPIEAHWFDVVLRLQMGVSVDSICDDFKLDKRDVTLAAVAIAPHTCLCADLSEFGLKEEDRPHLKQHVLRLRAINVMERRGREPDGRDLYYLERVVEQEARGVDPSSAQMTITMLSNDVGFAAYLDVYAEALLEQKTIALEELSKHASGEVAVLVNHELQLLQSLLAMQNGERTNFFIPIKLEDLKPNERALIKCIEEQTAEFAADFKEVLENLKEHVSTLVKNHKPKYPHLFGPEIKVRDTPAFKQIMDLTPEKQAQALCAIIHELQSARNTFPDYRCALEQLLDVLYKRNLPLSEVQLAALVNAAAQDYPMSTFSAPIILSQVEKLAGADGCSPVLEAALNRYESSLSKGPHHYSTGPDKEGSKLIHRIRMIIARGNSGEEPIPITPQEAWSDQAIADLKAMDSAARLSWIKLLDHCSRTSGTKPSGTWTKRANELIKPIGEEPFAENMHRWFSLIPKKGSREGNEPGTWGVDSAEVIRAQNVEILKGLAYCCVDRKDPRLASGLGDAAEASFKKVPNLGPRCPKLGNACVHALSSMNTKEAIAQLTRVQAKAKHSSVRTQIEKALNNAADKSGMSVDDMQDLGVPTFGMEEIGRLTISFGDWQAELTIEADAPTIRWISSTGKSQESVPAEVKKSHADELKELKKTETEIAKLLPGLRHRLEHSFIDQRHWTFGTWKERYLDHPVIAIFARRLLWTFSGRTGIWRDGRFIDQNGDSFEPEPNAIVELWHPIAADPSVVMHWRRWLSDNQVVQPFKQCHREIYVLTDAERTTGNYSNRFAGHIVRQHQLQHLAMQRGWTYQLMGSYSTQSVPTLQLPRWNMSVEYYVDVPEDERTLGVALVVSTDKVHFLRRTTREATPQEQALMASDPSGYLAKMIKKQIEEGTYEPIDLTELMPIVFSEVMRDVDLFVSVCSIGADPNWTEDQGFGDYWTKFSFGELGQTAETRKQVIEALLPHLKISSRCKIDGKFLVVQGDLRTYKIHFGSGNILMEPNDQYLCIVAAKGVTSTREKVFLPFEGDAILSLILSKALMLADDTNIKDTSIVNQIKSNR